MIWGFWGLFKWRLVSKTVDYVGLLPKKICKTMNLNIIVSVFKVKQLSQRG